MIILLSLLIFENVSRTISTRNRIRSYMYIIFDSNAILREKNTDRVIIINSDDIVYYN